MEKYRDYSMLTTFNPATAAEIFLEKPVNISW